MKGPSLDAIRRYKEQQEQKKREDEEQRVQQKLATLEHRASKGDRKAKQELKVIEQIKESRNKPLDPGNAPARSKPGSSLKQQPRVPQNQPHSKQAIPKKSKGSLTDFEELMRLAKQNKNEMRKPAEIPKQSTARDERIPRSQDRQISAKPIVTQSDQRRTMSASSSKIPESKRPPVVQNSIKPIVKPNTQYPRTNISRPPLDNRPRLSASRPPPNMINRNVARRQQVNRFDDDDDDDYYDEDDYEEDDFVVDEDDDAAQDEVSKTIRSVFGYDKRRCDMREAELDRQYRAIGRVNTFEDLEREERRATKLAAMEDARAQREEEERKRLKKIRLKNMK